jgi:hypothetical protein
LGYSAVTKEITLDKNISIDVELTEAAKELKEVCLLNFI